MMRILFVLTTIAVALVLSVVAAASESRLLVRALIVGFMPAIWAVSYAVERLAGRDLWHFSAPYPYRWMRNQGETAMPRPVSRRKPVESREDADGRAILPLAA